MESCSQKWLHTNDNMLLNRMKSHNKMFRNLKPMMLLCMKRFYQYTMCERQRKWIIKKKKKNNNTHFCSMWRKHIERRETQKNCRERNDEDNGFGKWRCFLPFGTVHFFFRYSFLTRTNNYTTMFVSYTFIEC